VDVAEQTKQHSKPTVKQRLGQALLSLRLRP
jgi:hypothetical protein